MTQSPTLTARAEDWPLARPFRISRGVKTTARVIVCQLDVGGVVGWGEAVPYARFGETVEDSLAQLESLAGDVANGLDRKGLCMMAISRAAKNALDCAFWDLEAKLSGRRAWDLAEIRSPNASLCAETISIASVDEMTMVATSLAMRPLIKIKVDNSDVVEKIGAIRRAAPRARLIVDANESWTAEQLVSWAEPLAHLGVEMIEQPVAYTEEKKLLGYNPLLTVCADESCLDIEDLVALPSFYRMINVKLDKTGGLTAALALVRAAQNQGIAIMIGCMIATSLSMAPATLLGAYAEYVDLDGPLWLSQDREPRLRYEQGHVYPPDIALWG